MASGDTLFVFTPTNNVPPASAFITNFEQLGKANLEVREV